MLHIARDEDWARARETGVYANATHRSSGIIYCCEPSQLRMVVDAHFPDAAGWLVLTLDESGVSGEIRRVTFQQGGRVETFPHLHGTFPASAVREVVTLVEALRLYASS